MSEFVITIDGKKRTVLLKENSVVVDGNKVENVVHSKINGNLNLLKIGNTTFEIPTIVKDKNNFVFHINGLKYEVTARTKLEEQAREVMKNRGDASADRAIKAPMPGMVLAIKKNVGDEVKPGDALFILEAMKMENEIRAVREGKIKEVLVESGQSVEKNQTVLIVE